MLKELGEKRTGTEAKRVGAVVNLVDVALSTFLLIAIVVLAPVFYDLIDLITGSTGQFTALVLQLTIPLLIIGLIISIAISART